jgi:hypothetical protein
MNDSLVTFLTSSLNVELVHVILKGIAYHGCGKVEGNVNQYSFEDKDFKETKKFLIDSIKINNPDDWKVAKLPDYLVDQYDLSPRKKSHTSTINRDTIKRPSHVIGNDISLGLFKRTELDIIEEEDNRLIINEDIYVTEYAPDIFAFLRQLDGIDNNTIKESLSPDANREMVFKAGESQGKSGSFFFFSHDKQFIIKTMTQ